jgi:threonyl-tRNA synthetase
MTTIQFDFNMSERFGSPMWTRTVGRSGIHGARALLGSLERFFGVLIEHYGGAFPLWLAPVQMMIVPVAEAFNDYGARVMAELRSRGFRVELDGSDSRMNAKIRNAQNRKIPYMLVVGQKEMDENAVSLRLRTASSREP